MSPPFSSFFQHPFSDHPCSRGSPPTKKPSHPLLPFSHLAKRDESKATCFDGSFLPAFHALRRSPLITNSADQGLANPAVVTGYMPVAQTRN
ncbi:hypothetical protein Hanom_Chr09g00768181 [Helianthus anomalus]